MTAQHSSRWTALGSRIREARAQAGLTQKRLGVLAGVSTHTVWCWEAGRAKPTHEHLVELAFHLETSVAELEGRDVVEAELLKETEVYFRDAVDGLPMEDVQSIQNYIRFVRAERRKRRRLET